MRDFLETLEDRAEAWAIDNMRGDEFKCSCGKWCKLSEGETMSPNPYAIPLCRQCFDDEYDKLVKAMAAK